MHYCNNRRITLKRRRDTNDKKDIRQHEIPGISIHVFHFVRFVHAVCFVPHVFVGRAFPSLTRTPTACDKIKCLWSTNRHCFWRPRENNYV